MPQKPNPFPITRTSWCSSVLSVCMSYMYMGSQTHASIDVSHVARTKLHEMRIVIEWYIQNGNSWTSVYAWNANESSVHFVYSIEQKNKFTWNRLQNEIIQFYCRSMCVFIEYCIVICVKCVASLFIFKCGPMT